MYLYGIRNVSLKMDWEVEENVRRGFLAENARTLYGLD